MCKCNIYMHSYTYNICLYIPDTYIFLKESHYVTLAVLSLLVHQAGLQLTDSACLCFQSIGIKGVYHIYFL